MKIMSDFGSNTAPWWFKIAAVVAILWGLAGVYACYSQLSLSAEQMAALPAEQRDAFIAMPGFIKGAYAIAVGAGLVGGVLLLMRKAPARIAFIVSLVGVVLQFGWVFGPYQGLAKLGASAMVFPAFIAAVGVAEFYLSVLALKRRWIA